MSRRSETIAFQTSKTVRRIRLPQGTIRRVSASVLVDHGVRWEGSGAQQKRVMTPPSADTIRAIRVLVTGALGLQEDRGDQVVVESLPFETTLQSPPPTAVTTPTAPVQRMPFGFEPWMLAAGAGGITVLGMLAFAVRRMTRKKGVQVKTNATLPPGADGRALPSGANTRAFTGRQRAIVAGSESGSGQDGSPGRHSPHGRRL